MSPHKLFDFSWKIVSVKQPVMFQRTLDEVWVLNPNRRYILNSHHVINLAEYVETVSDFDNAALYVPLLANHNISGATVLIERLRERGIGDLMFLTGPLAFFQHVTGNNVTVDVYTLSDRGVVLQQNTDLRMGAPLCGPIEYDHLRAYNYHWFIKSVTESDEEPDQANVYDALYKQLGFDPTSIDAMWKRPKAVCNPDDFKNLDQLYRMVWLHQKLDLRHVSYYVVAPFAAATLRSMNYNRWLEIIKLLATRRPVVVVGSTRIKLPDMGISAGHFVQAVGNMGGAVINAIDGTPLRVLMALIARARALVCLDSGPLYVAQGLRTPAVSLWGSHHPGVRLAYDKDYMDLAVWPGEFCQNSPCFAYLDFPENKCPRGRLQTSCEVLSSITPDHVLSKVDMIESASPQQTTFQKK